MISKLKPSEFNKNVLTLVGGSGFGQLITILASPILTRCFTPEEFAPLTLFTTIVGLIVVVASARFELAILLPKEEKDAKSLVVLSFIITTITSFITLVGVVVYDLWLYQFWPSGNFNGWFYLLPPTIFIMGSYKVLNFWSTRIKTYKRNAIGRIVISLTLAGLSLIFAFYNYVPGLIIAFVLGNLGGLIVMLRDVFKSHENILSGQNKNTLKSVFRQYQNFAKVNLPHALVDKFQEFGIVFIIAFFFKDAMVGLYGQTFRILKAPLGLIGSAYYQVFYQRISNPDISNEEVRKMVLRVFRNTFLIGIIPFTILAIFAPDIFAFIFGENWRESGEISQILIPWIFLNFMLSPVSSIPLKYNKLKGAFILSCADVALKILLFACGAIMQNSTLAFAGLSLAGSLTMLFGMWWYLRICSVNERPIN